MLYIIIKMLVIGGVSLKIKSNLSTLMGQRRYSIQDVHIKTGLSRNTISNLYNDKARRIDYDTLEKLCEVFKCNISDIFVEDING